MNSPRERRFVRATVCYEVFELRGTAVRDSADGEHVGDEIPSAA
jgi:hypothetical protein